VPLPEGTKNWENKLIHQSREKGKNNLAREGRRIRTKEEGAQKRDLHGVITDSTGMRPNVEPKGGG